MLLRAAATFAKACGRIDAVINNAMLLKYEPVEMITEETLNRMVSIGINGSVWGAQALLAHYDPSRGGAIINMASPVAEKGFPNTAAYSLVKGAIVTLTKVLAAELGPRGIRVNAIAPGSVPTPGALGLNDKAEYERRTRTIPLRRLGSEEDNAEACAFLLSDSASFVNGEILHVDGGIAAAG
jgi:meso-butanediol dehydrogenase/(S,S)-butanediol dehydrogenase/diacetyl reductase